MSSIVPRSFPRSAAPLDEHGLRERYGNPQYGVRAVLVARGRTPSTRLVDVLRDLGTFLRAGIRFGPPYRYQRTLDVLTPNERDAIEAALLLDTYAGWLLAYDVLEAADARRPRKKARK